MKINNKLDINKTFDYLKDTPEYIDYLLLSILIFFIGYYLGAWTGFLKGDDAYWHLSSIKFIADSFPNIAWYPYNFFGYDLFPKYPYVFYLILALVYKITGMELDTLLKAVFLISSILLGFSIFKLSKLLNIPRLEGIALSLLIFTAPAFWNVSILGGAYQRVITLPFIVFSFIYSIKHIDTINDGGKGTAALLKVVGILSLTAFLHPRLFLFTIIATILMYILGIENIILKIKNFALVFIPVSIITSWVYIPYLTSENLGISFHYYIPNPMSGLFSTLPTTNLTLNLLYAFLTVILMLPLLILLLKYIKSQPINYKRSTLSFLITSLLFSLYHLLFGWFSMPKSLYVISSYNSADWLAFFLLLFIISSYSLFRGNFMNKASKFDNISVALILLVILELSFTLPLVKNNFISYTAPDDPLAISYDLSRQTFIASIDKLEGYRLGVTHRVFTRWINYAYPYLDITGGRLEPLQPNKEYQDWFTDRVFYRYDHENFEQMYIDDKPKILPEYGFLDDKSINPSLWFLDWTGSSGIILYPNIMLNWNTTQEYLKRTYIFEIESGKTRFGDIYYVKYNKSSPIIVASNVPTLAIPSEPQNRDSLFRKTLMILSYVNANSKVIIPIKIDLNKVPLAELNKFNSILVTDELYQTYNKELIKYVGNGGILLITDKGKSETLESKQIVNRIEQVGNGKIVWLNVSIDEIFNAQDFVTIFNFVHALNPSLHVENVGLSTEWNNSQNSTVKPEPRYVWKNPQEIIINLQNISKGILFKESFNKNWRAYAIYDGKIEGLPIYFAGPSFMYIENENITFPANVTLKYETKMLNFNGG